VVDSLPVSWCVGVRACVRGCVL